MAMLARVLMMATLVTAAIMAAGCGAVRSAAKRAGVCRTPLTLTLIPGFHMPNSQWYGAHFKSAPDIPRRPTIVRLPLYPGLHRSSRPLPFPQGIDYPATGYLKTAPATFLSHASVTRINSWYRRAFHTCGYRLSVTTGIDAAADLNYGNGMVGYTSLRNPLLKVELAYDHIRQGVLVLYEAEEIVLPPRPAGSYLPGDIVRISLSGDWPGFPKSGTITNAAAVRALVRAVNHLPVSAKGPPFLCMRMPPDPNVDFIFYPRHGHSMLVTDIPACGDLVRVGHSRLLQDQPGGIYDTVRRLDHAGLIHITA